MSSDKQSPSSLSAKLQALVADAESIESRLTALRSSVLSQAGQIRFTTLTVTAVTYAQALVTRIKWLIGESALVREITDNTVKPARPLSPSFLFGGPPAPVPATEQDDDWDDDDWDEDYDCSDEDEDDEDDDTDLEDPCSDCESETCPTSPAYKDPSENITTNPTKVYVSPRGTEVYVHHQNGSLVIDVMEK